MEAGITDWVDYLIIAIYFVFVFVVAGLSMCRKNRESVQGYFLAGRTMTWLPIGASLFASNIGSEHFVGLAGSGAASGIGVVSFEWGAIILLVLLGWVFLPIYLTAGVFTMPEYLGRRFGGTRMRIYLSLIALTLYVVTKVSVDMYAGVFFIQLATGWDMYLAMIPLLVVTALYTVAGGLAAVVFTDTLQTVVMVIGAVVLAILAFVEVGGFTELYTKYMTAYSDPTMSSTFSPSSTLDTSLTNSSIFISTISINNTLSSFYNISTINTTSSSNNTCGRPRADAFHMFRDPVTSDLPWPGVVFRATFASLWNWCADQVIVQRALAAKNMAHARAATVLAGYLKLTPMFLIIMPGMISRVLYKDKIACVGAEACRQACGNVKGCSNSAYPYLILKLAPVGIRGLLMAVMVAALMSSLTSIFNSAITVFTLDLWRRGRPGAGEKELLVVGRVFVLVLVAVSIAWIPLIMESQEGQLFMYIQAVTGYIAPPISAIFILAILVPWINEKGAFCGVLCGQVVGVVRLVLDFVYPSPGCGRVDERPNIVSKVHFTYFSIVVFGVTALVAVGVSLFTKPQDKRDLENLTVWTLQRQKRPDRKKKTKRGEDNNQSLIKGEHDVRKEHGGTTQAWVGNQNYPNEEGDNWQGKAQRVGIPKREEEYSQWKVAFRRFKDTSFSLTKSRNNADDGSPQHQAPPSQFDAPPTSHDPNDDLYSRPISDIDEPNTRARDHNSGDGVVETGEIIHTPEEITEKPIGLPPFCYTFKSYVDWPWSLILNVNAAVLLAVLVFLCAFFH